MLLISHTKNKIGLILAGDFKDLNSLYDSFSDLIDQSKISDKWKDFGYSFLYEIRKAYEGLLFKFNKNNLGSGYFGTGFLWITFVFYYKYFNYLKSINNPNKEFLSNWLRLQIEFEKLLLNIGKKIHFSIFNSVQNLENFSLNEEFNFEYIYNLDTIFYNSNPDFNNRIMLLNNFLNNLHINSEEYQKFTYKITVHAEQIDVSSENLSIDFEFPDLNKW